MVAFAKVVGRFMTWVIDSEDPDTDPDTIPLSGKISFALNVAKTGEAGASPDPVTYGTTAITALLDSSGYICTAKADGTILYRGLWLPATDDPGLNPTNLQYNVTYSLALGTQPIVIAPHTMALPMGSVVDLQAVIPPEDAPPLSLAAADAAAANAASSAAAAAASATSASDSAEIVQTAAVLYVANQSVSGSISLASVTQQQFRHYTLTGNLRITGLPSGVPAGFTISLELTQDATGGRTLQLDNVSTPNGVAIALTATANARDEVYIIWDGVRWKARLAGQADAIPASWVV